MCISYTRQVKNGVTRYTVEDSAIVRAHKWSMLAIGIERQSERISIHTDRCHSLAHTRTFHTVIRGRGICNHGEEVHVAIQSHFWRLVLASPGMVQLAQQFWKISQFILPRTHWHCDSVTLYITGAEASVAGRRVWMNVCKVGLKFPSNLGVQPVLIKWPAVFFLVTVQHTLLTPFDAPSNVWCVSILSDQICYTNNFGADTRIEARFLI